MKAIDVEEFAQICLDIEKDQKEQGNYANALFISELRKMISTFPTVDAVPVKHGRWIKGGYACGENEYKCSACGETEWRTGCARMKYCMCCGAKMDLEEQDAKEET